VLYSVHTRHRSVRQLESKRLVVYSEEMESRDILLCTCHLLHTTWKREMQGNLSAKRSGKITPVREIGTEREPYSAPDLGGCEIASWHVRTPGTAPLLVLVETDHDDPRPKFHTDQPMTPISTSPYALIHLPPHTTQTTAASNTLCTSSSAPPTWFLSPTPPFAASTCASRFSNRFQS
jgi:hypothetical protein